MGQEEKEVALVQNLTLAILEAIECKISIISSKQNL